MIKTYIIETLDDLLQVPSDKISVCLSELGIALMLARRVGQETSLTPSMKRFKWIDDGKTEFTGRVTLPSGEVLDFSGDHGTKVVKR